jgi:hypothetical protein
MKNQCWLLVQQSEFWIAWLIPRDEEDLALLASLLGDEVEVVDAVSALVGGEGGGEVVVGEVGLTELLDDDLLLLLVYPEDEEAVAGRCAWPCLPRHSAHFSLPRPTALPAACGAAIHFLCLLYIWPLRCRDPLPLFVVYMATVPARHGTARDTVTVPARAMGQAIGPRHGTRAKFPCRAAHEARPMCSCRAAHGPAGLI